MPNKKYDDETIEAARLRYLVIRNAKAVALEMRVPVRTVQGWALRRRWGHEVEEAERIIQEEKALAERERITDATLLAQVALADTLQKIPETRMRGRGEATQSALNLVRAWRLLQGESNGDIVRITQQALVILATGGSPSGGNEGQGRPILVSKGSAEVGPLGEAD